MIKGMSTCIRGCNCLLRLGVVLKCGVIEGGGDVRVVKVWVKELGLKNCELGVIRGLVCSSVSTLP